jgi:hypothetical protein
MLAKFRDSPSRIKSQNLKNHHRISQLIDLRVHPNTYIILYDKGLLPFLIVTKKTKEKSDAFKRNFNR